MSALIHPIDNFTPIQIGEKGSHEYTWSNNIRERILQLSFQLTRVREESIINKLYEQTDRILMELNGSYKTLVLNREEYLEYMSIMYRMIGYTRDIIYGKGEYTLSYMLLNVWYKHYPELAKFAFRLFLIPPNDLTKNFHPYGSWKDVKYLYKKYKSSPLVIYGCQLLINQLKQDSLSNNPSLAAKWVPREKSQFSELFTELAIGYFFNYTENAKTKESLKKSINKAKMNFRKLISSLNKKLDTVQIKQCQLNWSSIDPSKQTSITLHNQKRAFLNVRKNGTQKYQEIDRILCAFKFKEFAQKAAMGDVIVKGKRIGLNDFTKNALELINHNQKDSDEAAILNAQWLDNSNSNYALRKMIAMIDVSGSMIGEPLNTAIALGIRVAEKSILGKRLLSFSASPEWINLTEQSTFIEMVDKVRRSDWGINANFSAALNLILNAIIIQKLKPDEVEDMVLVVFSDMQMDVFDNKNLSLMAFIESQYEDAGIRLWGKPFKTPHILFWNLRSTSGFPTLSIQNNTSMMSGFSPNLLNLFCNEGLNAIQSCSPWSIFINSLNNERYKPLDNHIREML